MNVVTIVAADYHRNGVSGEGFYVVLFDDVEHGRMVATTFPKYGPDGEPDWTVFSGRTAVLQVEELAKGNIAFASGNSWRGDQYESALYPKLPGFLAEQWAERCAARRAKGPRA